MSLRQTRDAAEFGAQLHAAGIPLSRVGAVAQELCRLGRKRQRLNERHCNEGNGPAIEQADTVIAQKLKDLYYLELESRGIKLDEGSGDPRGCALHVCLPSGASNGWDSARGWCVPY